jgi:hypothetical protein
MMDRNFIGNSAAFSAAVLIGVLLVNWPTKMVAKPLPAATS